MDDEISQYLCIPANMLEWKSVFLKTRILADF